MLQKPRALEQKKQVSKFSSLPNKRGVSSVYRGEAPLSCIVMTLVNSEY